MAKNEDVKETLENCLKELHLPAIREGYQEMARTAQQESLKLTNDTCWGWPNGSASRGGTTGWIDCCGSRGCRWRRAGRGWT